MAQSECESLVADFIRAWLERNAELAVQWCHPEIEFLLPRNLLEGGSYLGLDGVRQAFADGFASWRSFAFHGVQVREAQDQVVALFRSAQTAHHDGPEVKYDLAYVFSLRDGKVIRAEPFLDHAAALCAAGLSE